MNGTSIIFMVIAVFFMISTICFFVRWRKEKRQSENLKKIVKGYQWFVSYLSTGIPTGLHEPFKLLIDLPFAEAKKHFSYSFNQFLSGWIDKQDLQQLGNIVLDLEKINDSKNFYDRKSYEAFSDWFEASLKITLKELKNNPFQATTMYLNTLRIEIHNPNIPCNNSGKEYFERIIRSDSEWAKMFFACLQGEIKAREVEPTWLSEDQRIILTGEMLKLQKRLNIAPKKT
jgi:hypothetical protein